MQKSNMDKPLSQIQELKEGCLRNAEGALSEPIETKCIMYGNEKTFS